eukprot:1974749-Amphidinium_carterae.1
MGHPHTLMLQTRYLLQPAVRGEGKCTHNTKEDSSFSPCPNCRQTAIRSALVRSIPKAKHKLLKYIFWCICPSSWGFQSMVAFLHPTSISRGRKVCTKH